jgi:hypothetical protein
LIAWVVDDKEEDEEEHGVDNPLVRLGIESPEAGFISADFICAVLLRNPFNGSKQIWSLWTARFPVLGVHSTSFRQEEAGSMQARLVKT